MFCIGYFVLYCVLTVPGSWKDVLLLVSYSLCCIEFQLCVVQFDLLPPPATTGIHQNWCPRPFTLSIPLAGWPPSGTPDNPGYVREIRKVSGKTWKWHGNGLKLVIYKHTTRLYP